MPFLQGPQKPVPNGCTTQPAPGATEPPTAPCHLPQRPGTVCTQVWRRGPGRDKRLSNPRGIFIFSSNEISPSSEGNCGSDSETGCSPRSTAIAIHRAGSSSLISLRRDFPISCVFWNLLMNPSILTWEKQPLGFLHMPKGLNM